jgi:hypothetical protein
MNHYPVKAVNILGYKCIAVKKMTPLMLYTAGNSREYARANHSMARCPLCDEKQTQGGISDSA